MRRNIFILMLLVLSLTFFACGGGSEGDGGDETPGGEVASDLELITDGIANFRIVLGEKIPTDVRKNVDQQIVKRLQNKHQIDVVAAQQGTENDKIEDVEVLIGDVTNRGEKYIFDRYEFGKEGYMIKIVGTKIVIQAGSDEMLLEAVMEFAEDVLEIESDYIENITMLAGDKSDKENPGNEVYVVQDNYKIDSLSVGSTDMKGYTIAVDSTDKYYKAAATSIQDTFYDKTGYFFPIVKPAEATDKSIVLKHIDRKTVSGDDTFTIKADGTKLVISCAYDNKLEESVGEFLSKFIILSQGDVSFSGTVLEKDISVVYYEDFGAVGNGTHDDFDAIYRTHEFANISGQTVKASKGAKYYIFDTAEEDTTVARIAKIKTNVDWQGAEFIIDDTDIGIFSGDKYKYLNTSLFQILPDNDLSVITLNASDSKHVGFLETILGDGINRNSTRIEIPKEAMEGWEGPVMIIPSNSSHNIYRRKGYGAASGSAMSEVILVNADGTIELEGDFATPVIFDYQSLSSVKIYRLDESTAITVKNGTFTTKACQANTVRENENGELEAFDTYVSRGISIQRSYTTLDNIKHYVEGEIELSEQVNDKGQIVKGGVPYSAFYGPGNAHHIIIQNCVLSGRRCYPRPQGGTTGTYDLSGSSVNYLIYKNCVQHNFWVTIDPDTKEITAAKEGDPGAKTSMSSYTVNGKSLQMHWGVGGTNRCKNLYYDGSTLSRFDAHEGLYNGGIINGSTVNYIELIGNGTFEFTDSRLFTSGNNVLLPLRSDYGWTWDGEMKVKNVEAFMYADKNIAVTYFGYNNWYFGYTCAFPSISLDNVDFYDIAAYYADFTLKPIDAGHEIWLTSSEIVRGSKMHLDISHKNPIYSIEDRDKDGFIDEPSFDRDGDGVVDGPIDLDDNQVIGNTRFNYAELYNEGKYDGSKNNNGVTDTNSYVNLCRVIPPEYIKIINNDGVNGTGGYRYIIWDTSGNGISDGGYYTETETFGGFFGATKFYYSDEDFFLGTGHGDQTATTPFTFRK